MIDFLRRLLLPASDLKSLQDGLSAVEEQSAKTYDLIKRGLDLNERSDMLTLARHQLASLDLSDLPRKQETPEERRARVARASAAFLEIEHDLRELEQQQLVFIGKEATDQRQADFGRGTLNGVALVREFYEKLHREHLADIAEAQNTEPSN